MGFSGSVNGTTKTQVFWILVFANVNGPNVPLKNHCFLALDMFGAFSNFSHLCCDKRKENRKVVLP